MLASLLQANPFHLVGGSDTFEAQDLITKARFDPVALVVVIAALAWYLRARAIARRRDDVDPLATAPWTLACWCWGLAVVAFVTMSGLAHFAPTHPLLHCTGDTLLLLVAAPLLATGGPLTLAFAAAGERGQARVRAVLASRVVRVLTFPVVTWALVVGLVIGLYIGGLYPYTAHHRWVADLTDLALLAVGYVFAWAVVGVDPLPRPRKYLHQIITLLLTLPFYTVVGESIDSSSKGPVAGQSLGSWHAGGDVLWSTGIMLGVVGVIVVIFVWAGGEQKASDTDPRAEAEAAAQLALWRATRQAITMEEALARSTVVREAPTPAEGGGDEPGDDT